MQSDNTVNTNLASQDYWDDAYRSYALESKVEDNDIIRLWLLRHLSKTNSGSCIEIGCFPGRYLTVMGDLGYELNGIDLTPRVENEFPSWLKKMGYKTGFFRRENFLEFRSPKRFDLVCSFGFIEHFTNWEDVFLKHIELVDTDGLLVIETPNFRGWFQWLIHRVLDSENYKRHYVPSMNPEKWKRICEENGFEIIFSGYIGEFQFWVDKQPTSWFKTKLLNRLIMNYDKLKAMKPGKKAYSPYCGIIARRKKQ